MGESAPLLPPIGDAFLVRFPGNWRRSGELADRQSFALIRYTNSGPVDDDGFLPVIPQPCFGQIWQLFSWDWRGRCGTVVRGTHRGFNSIAAAMLGLAERIGGEDRRAAARDRVKPL